MFYRSVKYSNPSLLSDYDPELVALLQSQEQSLYIENTKIQKYNSIARSVKIQVKYLTKDFLRSESSYFEAKSSLLKHSLSSDPNLGLLHEFLAFTPTSEKSFAKHLTAFTYHSLSDEVIEKFFGIWKAHTTELSGSKEILHFIGFSVESKMKSDLLNEASDRLVRMVNRIEGLKLNIEKIKEEIRETKKNMNWTAEETLGDKEVDQNFFLRSEDLYGLEFECGDSSTIIYQSDEQVCAKCNCVPF